ncbi:MAG: SHOCT domain-containing protein [Thiogranum sp.]|nr:SHOCT domain-containing protein [Thiogranum sp.]
MTKRYQRGDAGASMLVLMLVMVLGFAWWGGMQGSGHMSSSPPEQERVRTALELLDEAYARGEITREEYLQKREDLMTGNR